MGGGGAGGEDTDNNPHSGFAHRAIQYTFTGELTRMSKFNWESVGHWLHDNMLHLLIITESLYSQINNTESTLYIYLSSEFAWLSSQTFLV